MRIPWKLKSFVFGFIDNFYCDKFMYFLQKHYTRRARRIGTKPREAWLFHAANLSEIKTPTVLEFGAGKHMAQNIFLSLICRRQVAVDINTMFDASLADKFAAALSDMCEVPYSKINAIADLGAYGIEYRAPIDVAHTDFEDDTFDACISTDTLEHIPEEKIVAIFHELRRVIKPGGVISLVIDYADHYAYTDDQIGRLHFLRYNEKEYARYNHRVHFQNRLRHYDYHRLWAELGFSIVHSEATRFAPHLEKIDNSFDAADPNIFATEGYFLLRNLK